MSTSLHLGMVLFVLAVTLATLGLGARSRRRGRVEATRRAFGGVMLTVVVAYNVYYFLPGVFAWDTSLPLHVCDVLAVAAAVTLLRPNRIGRSILYFSGLSLASQAILTPTGDQSPSSLRFWLYWWMHAGIIAASFFDLTVKEYRPTGADLRRVVAADALYVVVILPLDLALGWNYGYLGDSLPRDPTLLDHLGPWPLRLVPILLLGVALQALMLGLFKAGSAVASSTR